MPKILCDCGQVLRYGDIPCEIEYKFISDVEYDKYEGEDLIDPIEFYMNMKSFLKCTQCDMLWVYWNGFGSVPTGYKLT